MVLVILFVLASVTLLVTFYFFDDFEEFKFVAFWEIDEKRVDG